MVAAPLGPLVTLAHDAGKVGVANAVPPFVALLIVFAHKRDLDMKEKLYNLMDLCGTFLQLFIYWACQPLFVLRAYLVTSLLIVFCFPGNKTSFPLVAIFVVLTSLSPLPTRGPLHVMTLDALFAILTIRMLLAARPPMDALPPRPPGLRALPVLLPAVLVLVALRPDAHPADPSWPVHALLSVVAVLAHPAHLQPSLFAPAVSTLGV